MPTIGNQSLSIIDVAKRLDPNGDTADVAELLAQTNEIIQDIPWVEGNLPTGNRTTIRTGLPTPTWRKMYGGVPVSKSTTAQVDDTTGQLTSRSEPDVDSVRMANNPATFRMDEASTHIEAMGQGFCTALLYGDTSINPEQFYGLQPRYNELADPSNSPSAQNVVDGRGTGSDNTSIYLIGWGKTTAFGIYPKNSKAGIVHQDLGEIDAFDTNNNRYRAYGDLFKWDCGLVVKDWRYVARLANVDVSDASSGTGTMADQKLIELLIDLKHRLPRLSGNVQPRIYVNRTIRAALDKMALNKSHNALSIREAADQFETNFLGIPIRTVDQLLNTEARVTA
ncbi:major capsid protein [Alcaligenes aquatilis]|uniref:major capsid protein n=1 Tax=Alcaligenes aquatilis TaxID=323284 RepID=UPI00361230D4